MEEQRTVSLRALAAIVREGRWGAQGLSGAAALIPLFFYGRAMLGRISGGAFLLIYFGYAAYRFINT